MKRILSVLCILAMLLSLPVAPGMMASAENADAKPSELVNLWTAKNRSWGLIESSKGSDFTTHNNGCSRRIPGHNSTEFMEIKKGDTVYFGPNASQDVYIAIRSGDQLGTTAFSWPGTKAACTVVDTFDNGWTVRKYTATEDGQFAFVNSTSVGDNYILLTKNQPFDCQGYLDYFGNNAYPLNANGKYLGADAVETENSKYNTTAFIKVTPGETLTMGPVTSAQAYFGYAYDANKNPVAAITKEMLTKVDDFDYTTGYYTQMGSSSAGPNNGHSFLVDETAAFYSCTVPEGVGYIRVTFDAKAAAKAMVVRGTMDMDAYKTIAGVGTANVLAGKTALFVGDSITHASGDYSWPVYGMNYLGWPGRIAMANDMLVYNYGRTSSSLSTQRVGSGKTGMILDQLNNSLVAEVDFDYVVIGGGVNDMWDRQNDDAFIGTVGTSKNYADFDLDTFAGGLEATLAKAIEYYGETAAISYIISQRIDKHSGFPNNQAVIAKYNAVAKAACEKWGINVIDLYNNEVVNAEYHDVVTFAGTANTVECSYDNLHPNAMGFEILAPEIAKGMKAATPMNGEAYEPVSLKEANLWTLDNRNWGVRMSEGTDYFGTYADGTGRRNPNHNSSEWITVKKGDQIYFGAAYVPNASHFLFRPAGSQTQEWNDTKENHLWLDTFTNSDFKIGVWKAPSDGELSLVNRQAKGNDDFYLITKNRPFSMKEYLDYFNNNVWILESQGKYVDAAGAEVADANYFTTDYIKVTEGEVLTVGPVVNGEQLHFGAAYSAAKKPVKAITLNDMVYKDSFDYATGYYSYSASDSGKNGAQKVGKTPDLYEYYLAAGADVYTYTVPAEVEYVRFSFLKDARTKAFVLRGDVGIEGYYASLGLQADHPLIGKTALCMGDSISEGANDYQKEGVRYRSWAGRLADQYDMLVDNFGVSSYSFSTKQGNKRISDQLHAARNFEYDYVIIHGGVNDLRDNDLALGTVDPDEFDMSNFDIKTFAGAMEYTVAKAVEQYGDNATILYLWNFEIKNSNWFLGCDKGCQTRYEPVAKAICEKWGIPVVDLLNDPFIREEFLEEDDPVDPAQLRSDQLKGSVLKVMDGTFDNIHPNALGYDMITKVLGEQMATLDPVPYNGEFASEDKEDTVIAVIGDDITAGFGSSDIYRKSYPALMQDILGEDYQVYNYGVSTATLQSDLKYGYMNSLVAPYVNDIKADKLVIMLGSLDLKVTDLTVPKIEEKLTDELAKMVSKYQKDFPGVEIYIATPPAATNKTLAAALPVAAPLYQKAATKLGVNFIDVYSATKAQAQSYVSTASGSDGVWYNDAGHEKIAETVLAALNLTATVAPTVDSTAEYDGTYPSVPTLSQYKAAEKYRTFDAYRVVTAADWKVFGDLVASGVNFKGKTVYLENDLDLTDKNVRPIGITGTPSTGEYKYTTVTPASAKTFQGTFDGNGYTINYHYRYFNAGVGLFASTYGAVIKNLNLTGSLIGHEMMGSVAGFCDGGTKLINLWSGVDVNCIVVKQANGVGGLVATFTGAASMENVGYSGTVIGQRYVAAFAAYAQENKPVAVKNCYFDGKIETSSYDVQTNILVRNAAESVHSNNMIIAARENKIPTANYAATVEKDIFTTGEAAERLNTSSDVWTVKNGKTVIASREEITSFPVVIDGKKTYTDNKGKVVAEVKTETGYFLIGNELKTDAEVADMVLSKETGVLNSVAKLAGDADGDGSFALPDITATMRVLVFHPERIVEVNADYTGNGKLNSADIVRMLQAQC